MIYKRHNDGAVVSHDFVIVKATAPSLSLFFNYLRFFCPTVFRNFYEGNTICAFTQVIIVMITALIIPPRYGFFVFL